MTCFNEEQIQQYLVWDYKNGGEFIAKSSFITECYDLEIKPSKMAFHDGYVYALVTRQNTQGIPLRLVRFKTESIP